METTYYIRRPLSLEAKKDRLTAERFSSDAPEACRRVEQRVDPALGLNDSRLSDLVDEAIADLIEDAFDADIPPDPKQLHAQVLAALRWRESQTDADIVAEYAVLDAQSKEEGANRGEDEFLDSHAPDYEEWTGYQRWTVEESAALLIGVDPDAIDALDERAKLKHKYNRLVKQIVRTFRDKNSSANVERAKIIEWAQKQNISFSDKLLHKNVSDKIDSREIGILYRVILSVCVKRYEFDPGDLEIKGAHIPALARIQADIDSLGLKISDSTLRKHLKAAHEYAKSHSATIAKTSKGKTQ